MSEPRMMHSRRGISAYSSLAMIIFAFFIFQAASTVFLELGIPFWVVLLIIPGSLIGSVLNIHIANLEVNSEGCETEDYIVVWGVSYKVHHPECPGDLELSVNVGGAIIPIIVSTYLLFMNPDLIIASVISVLIVSLAVKRIAKVVPEVGIVTPSLIPPFIASLTTFALFLFLGGMSNPYVVAYVAGTLGTLIGADLLNIPNYKQFKTGKASIGGAGTWDGVFLTGLFAVILVGFL